MTERSVTVRLDCQDFPGIRCIGYHPVWVGPQKGKETVDAVSGDSESASFDYELRVREGKNGEPNFLGPYAHGTPQDRFLYLVWFEKRLHGRSFRRAKIKLGHLTWERIDRAAESGEPIVARVKMTDHRGGPVCATLKDTHVVWD